MTYNDYIKSKEWLIKRTEVMANPYYGRPKECFVCSGNEQLVVHQLTYDRIGNENDDDLMILCNKCHNFVHTENNKHTSDKSRILKIPFFSKIRMIEKKEQNRLTWSKNVEKQKNTKNYKKQKLMKRTGLPVLLHASMFAYLNREEEVMKKYDDPVSAFIEYFEKKKRIGKSLPKNEKKKVIVEQYIKYKQSMIKYLQQHFNSH